MCVSPFARVNEFVNVWCRVIENHSEYTVLCTVYELCLPHMVTGIALYSLRRKTDKSAWKGGAMDDREEEEDEGMEWKNKLQWCHSNARGSLVRQQCSNSAVKHFTLGFSISSHLSFLSPPARFPFLSLILVRVRASKPNLCYSVKQMPNGWNSLIWRQVGLVKKYYGFWSLSGGEWGNIRHF